MLRGGMRERFMSSMVREDLPAAAAAAKSLQSCPTLCDPMDGSPPGSPIPGILQARILEWVAISFSNAWKWKVKVKTLSCVRLSATPWTVAYQAPPSMGFSRQEYWSGVPFPSLRSPWGGDIWEWSEWKDQPCEIWGRVFWGKGHLVEKPRGWAWGVWGTAGKPGLLEQNEQGKNRSDTGREVAQSQIMAQILDFITSMMGPLLKWYDLTFILTRASWQLCDILEQGEKEGAVAAVQDEMVVIWTD